MEDQELHSLEELLLLLYTVELMVVRVGAVAWMVVELSTFVAMGAQEVLVVELPWATRERTRLLRDELTEVLVEPSSVNVTLSVVMKEQDDFRDLLPTAGVILHVKLMFDAGSGSPRLRVEMSLVSVALLQEA